MSRTEKYRLERTLMELENLVESLVNYIIVHKAIVEMFNDPMERIESWFECKEKQ